MKKDKAPINDKKTEWNSSFTISESEYESLREEIIQRIILMNSQATNAITVVLTMWAAGLGLLGIQLANLEKINIIHNLALCIGETGSFFCALLILVPLALKSGENLRQQVAIGTYIRLFYYEFVRMGKIKSNNIYPWEYVNRMTNDIFETGKKGKKNKLLLILTNSEYPILGLVSVVFSLCVFITNYNFIYEKFGWCWKSFIFIACAVGVEIVELIMVFFLYRKTSINRNITLIADSKVNRYREVAIKMGIIK